MKSKSNSFRAPIYWVILLVLLMAIATLWWFGREIRSIDQRIESMEKI